MRPFLKGLAMMLVLALAGYLFHQSDFGSGLNERWIDAQVRGHGMSGALLFLGMGALFTSVGVPRQVLAFLGGYAFGLAWGVPLAALGAILGGVINFVLARWVFRRYIGGRLGARVERFDRFIAYHPFSMTLLIRLLPAGSNLVTNLLAGLSRIPAGWFFLGSFVGYLPQTLIFALIGSGVQVDATHQFTLAAALFGVSGALGAWLYKRYRDSANLVRGVDAAQRGNQT